VKNVISMLEGGDRRSIGRVNEVVRVVETMMKNGNPAVRARGRRLLSQLEAERGNNERRYQ